MIDPASRTSSVSFAPAPGAAPLPRMVLAQAGMELRVLLRNGEQLLLTMVIPVLLLVGFSMTSLIDIGGGSRVDFLAPGVIALAVMSTAFTGQAIGTGFERRYGVLKRLGATPLSRFGLLGAKTLAVLAVQVVQITLLSAVALTLGWSPRGGLTGALACALVILLATAAFSSLALLMAGTLRAEATLAAANLVYVVLLGLGGVVFPIDRYPDAVRPFLEALPITALADGLRSVLTEGAGLPLAPLLVLAVWAVAGSLLASRLFRWE
ncbi:ABC transporter permease [Marinactinospora thermotolerans]|uniref:Transport permease protein n=1 Tax=Marinactinospora thermotolerans DSM 45154 TaxID=1122192 RepID=A0A1T4S3K1_9ACTN|nr:ABC transporter permease [Marinactinospora thermotolerans]SKA22795.1 ABC-2 type transport system permease protein [Marinactinospora thermotolerans DSM 45154]